MPPPSRRSATREQARRAPRRAATPAMTASGPRSRRRSSRPRALQAPEHEPRQPRHADTIPGEPEKTTSRTGPPTPTAREFGRKRAPSVGIRTRWPSDGDGARGGKRPLAGLPSRQPARGARSAARALFATPDAFEPSIAIVSGRLGVITASPLGQLRQPIVARPQCRAVVVAADRGPRLMRRMTSMIASPIIRPPAPEVPTSAVLRLFAMATRSVVKARLAPRRRRASAAGQSSAPGRRLRRSRAEASHRPASADTRASSDLACEQRPRAATRVHSRALSPAT